MMIKYYKISGKVQGVYFRGSTQNCARQLHLAGWVRNCSDGSVEAVASGEQKALESFEQWLAIGPEMADVRDLQIQILTPSDSDFSRLAENVSPDFDIL